MRDIDAMQTATAVDTLNFLRRVVLPTFGKGVIIRRRSMEYAAAHAALDLGAVREMQRLREKYGAAPLLLKLPFRPQVVLLYPRDVEYVLTNSPEPFATATAEKKAALAHLEPGNVLISDAPRRAEVRPVHDHALASHKTLHPFADHFQRVIDEEFDQAFGEKMPVELDWSLFSKAWFRIVRRLVLGDCARDDSDFTDLLNRLRGRANWAFFLRRDKSLLEEFQTRLHGYVSRAERGSLVARIPVNDRLNPESQVTQWLFAFDPAGMATFRTLAVLASHPKHLKRVGKEATDGDLDRQQARSCVLETLRLWPTTPAILRELTRDFGAGARTVKKGTGVIIFTPFFHRDTRLPYANSFEPKLWAKEHAFPLKGLVPFSAGPAMCPAHNLVPLVASLALGAVLSRFMVEPVSPKLDPGNLPGTLNHFEIRVRLRAK
jgi:cytochrome P450